MARPSKTGTALPIMRPSALNRIGSPGFMLAEKMRRDDAYERAHQDWKADRVRFCSDGSPYPRREDLYDRRVARS